jgi:hypothetical protein
MLSHVTPPSRSRVRCPQIVVGCAQMVMDVLSHGVHERASIRQGDATLRAPPSGLGQAVRAGSGVNVTQRSVRRALDGFLRSGPPVTQYGTARIGSQGLTSGYTYLAKREDSPNETLD